MTEREQRVRVDRAHDDRRVRATRAREDEGPLSRPLVVDAPAFFVFAVLGAGGERLSKQNESVLAAARHLADATGEDGAVVAISSHPVGGLAAYGVDRSAAHDAMGAGADVAADALADFWKTENARHAVFMDNSEGRDFARRFAAKLHIDAVIGVHAFSGGMSLRFAASGDRELVQPPPPVLTVMEGAAPKSGTTREARPMEWAINKGEVGRIRQLSVRRPPPEGIALGDARFVIGGGAGVSDWEAFHAAARALGAASACTRVVADLGHMPRDRQVGASGSLVEADCYIAFGVSGAQQHLLGIERCDRVIAVNTDMHAPIFARADLGIVADADAVLAALALRGGGER